MGFLLVKKKIMVQSCFVMKNKFFYILEIAIVTIGFIMMEASLAAGDYKVVDGDSLEKGNVRIRLLDIDAPELFQDCYDENDKKYACGEMAMSVLQKFVDELSDCEASGEDRYKRLLMECFTNAGDSINREMVEQGWAVAYGERYQMEEQTARLNKRGIWRGRFMRPELYRALQKSREQQNKMKKR